MTIIADNKYNNVIVIVNDNINDDDFMRTMINKI